MTSDTTTTAYCSACGTPVDRDTAAFCSKCGSALPSATPVQQPSSVPLELICSSCRSKAQPGQRFCRTCGTELVEKPSSPTLPASTGSTPHGPLHFSSPTALQNNTIAPLTGSSLMALGEKCYWLSIILAVEFVVGGIAAVADFIHPGKVDNSRLAGSFWIVVIAIFIANILNFVTLARAAKLRNGSSDAIEKLRLSSRNAFLWAVVGDAAWTDASASDALGSLISTVLFGVIFFLVHFTTYVPNRQKGQ